MVQISDAVKKAKSISRKPTPAQSDGEEAETFGGFLEGEAEGMAEMAFKGGGGEAMDMFDEDSAAMKSLLDGGGKPLEMLQVALGWLQSFSLVALLEMEWPSWFAGLTFFTLDFSFSEDAGEWPSIIFGLSVAPALILALDHGLFVTRYDHRIVQETVTNVGMWKAKSMKIKSLCACSALWIMFFVLSRSVGSPGYYLSNLLCILVFIFTLGIMAPQKESSDPRKQRAQWVRRLVRWLEDHANKRIIAYLLGLCILLYFGTYIGTAGGSDSDATLGKSLRADVYNLGIVGLLFLYGMGQLVHWGYLRRLLKTCERTNENFKLKRCWGEFTTFLFLFLIVYLTGVNATLQMTQMEFSGGNETAPDCERFKFGGCYSPQTDGVFVESFSPTICNGAPIYRSNLLYADIKKTEGKVREIFSVVGSSTQTRTWYMTERFLALDDEGEAEERSMEMCGAGLTVVESSAFAEQTVVELSDAGQTVVLTLLGRGCEGCAEMQSTSSWICEYLESSLTSYNGLAKEVTFQQLDDGPCFHWKAQHPRPFCGESCMSNANKIGWVLFCFYTLVPLFRLWKMGRAVKAVLNKFEGDYEDSFEALALKARTASTHSDFGGVDNVEGDQLLPRPKKWWGNENINDDLGIQLAVSSAVLAAFEERWWWWKLFLMTERGVLATCVFTEVSVWAAFAVTLVGVAGSFYTRPYWEDEEDTADIIARCTTLLSVFLACLAESEAITGDEIVVAIVLNVSSFGTLVMLVMALGPRRMLYSVIAFYNVKRRELNLSLDKNAAQNMSEVDALAMTDKEFLSKSKKIRGDLMRRYQDHSELAVRWLDWVRNEEGNELDLDSGEKRLLEEAAEEFGKSMCWLYSAGDGSIFGCVVVNSRVVSLNWQGQGLMARKIPAALFKLKEAKDINLTSNDVYISDATTAKVKKNQIFHVGNRQEKEVLEEVAKKMGQTLEWLHDGQGEHNVGQWKGVKMDEQGVQVERLGWAGQGLRNNVCPELSKLKGLKSLDLRFNACKFGANKVVNTMVDHSRSQAGGDIVRIASTNPGIAAMYVKGKAKEYNNVDYAILDFKQWRYRMIRLDLTGLEAFMFEDMSKEGLVLAVHKGMLCRVSKGDLAEYGGVEAAAWLIRPGMRSGVNAEGAERVCSIESVHEKGCFICHLQGVKEIDSFEDRVMLRVRKPNRRMADDQKVQGTFVENTGEVYDEWKMVCTFKLVPDVEVKDDGAEKKIYKEEMIHGWDGGLVDHKLNDLLKRLGGEGDGDTGLLFDSTEEKVTLCDCARSMGKTVSWLLNGGGGYDISSWRGVSATRDGRVKEIEWVDEELAGSLPVAFASFEKLERLDLSGNEDIDEEIPAELGALRSRLGKTNCILFTEPDHRSWAEKRLEKFFKPQNLGEVFYVLQCMMGVWLLLMILSAIVEGAINMIAVNISFFVVFGGGFAWAHKEKWLFCGFVPPPPPPKPAHALFKRTATQKNKKAKKKQNVSPVKVVPVS
ncbi:hypothetical protein TrVE_jg4670 [Triparma verrucosa]|uniref:Uncharacterized protein n=1 Tax=Triparma verrucosa TaxID=1606542 RepID=A0A9W7ER03_9STRA|nr:hypothetical protein TrVE_jg4670 [Triparma verrucosa]